MKTLYFGGPILTMDKAIPSAEALLEQDGKIIAVGSLAELEKLAADSSRVDLGGHTLMPSFIDGHSHMAGTGLLKRKCDLFGCVDFDDMLERIRKFRQEKNLVNGEPISCRGYDQTEMKEKRHPNAAILDSLGFDNPIVCVHQSGHMLACNTIAMQVCGVDDDYKFPEGGYVERDENGHLTGFFEENAKQPILSYFESFTDEQYENAILAAQEYYFSKGVTTIQDGSGHGPKRFACYERLVSSGRLKADVVVYISSDPEKADFWKDALNRHGNREYRSHLKIGGIKIMLDGSPQAKTAWMRKPYEGTDGYCGYPVLEDERVFEILCAAIDHDLQPIAHCNGDAAAEQFLTAWERAVAEKGRGTSLRPVMIHAQTVGYDQLDRMKSVGMMPSFFVGHCYFWGDTHLKNFGSERGNRISPVKAAIDRELPYNFHQDCPVTPPEMLHTVWCAVNRITKNGVCIGPENRIDVYDALIGVTRGGAYSYFEEETKGVLRPGAVADMVILDRNPTAVDPMEIKDIKVLRTIKDGKTVFSTEN